MSKPEGYAPMPVLIRGVTYGSIMEASKALGVEYGAVSSALERGRPDSVGEGRNAFSKKRLSYDGVEYESVSALANHLGMKGDTLRTRINTYAKRGAVLHKNGIPVIVLGRKVYGQHP